MNRRTFLAASVVVFAASLAVPVRAAQKEPLVVTYYYLPG